MLKLAFLWHQHQPYYKNLITGEYLLPWVRLHGVKDYLDMVEILKGFPSIKQIFNFVPSLLEQIIDYADGNALDPHLKLSMKKASDLLDDEKSKMLDLLFQANHDNLIAPSRKYKSLYSSKENAINQWSVDDWRDLQCLANLAWIDPMFKKEGRLKALVEKGQGYSEQEKKEILDHQQKIISKIIPTLKSYQDAGQIEISVTPFFHPIMPLLYDTSSALAAMPDAPMPEYRFNHPEDVDKQVEMAVNMYADLFGKSPVGMWPSEGSVSEDIIPILCKHGIKWIATDEEILSESVNIPARGLKDSTLVSSGELYRGYRFKKSDAEIALFFRDHALSDNIGFVYSGWDAEKAADDFIGKLKATHENLLKKKIQDPIVSIILDGENAWEYYKNDGHDFFNALYTKLSKTSWITTTTYNDYINHKAKTPVLKKLFPGSWINHNFSIWIGHLEDNKAWDLLSKARRELVEFQKTNPDFDKDKLDLAWKEIYIAEGSDWCWWFGDDHIGPDNDEFDSLYRSHLTNVYAATDREPPNELFTPVRSNFMLAHISKPIDYISPTIDGIISHIYEWNQAGFFDCMKAGSTMHKAENVLKGIWFGYDQDNLYLMAQRGITVDSTRFSKLEYEIEFQEPQKGTFIITKNSGKLEIEGREYSNFDLALKEILELSVPLDLFKMNDESAISIRLSVKEKGKLLESWPLADAIKIPIPKQGSSEIPWIV